MFSVCSLGPERAEILVNHTANIGLPASLVSRVLKGTSPESQAEKQFPVARGKPTLMHNISVLYHETSPEEAR